MKLNCLFFLLFPLFSFGQAPRIAFIESDSILAKSQWHVLLKEDINGLASFFKDSIIELEVERYTLRYKEITESPQYYCGYSVRAQMEIEQEMQDRQESLQRLAETAEELLLAYEDSLLILWEEELVLVVDSLAVVWEYDLVLRKTAMVFLDSDYTKAQSLFEEAIIKALNQKVDQVDWGIKTQKAQKECLKNIRKAIYVHSVDVKKVLSEKDVFRRVALWMHGAKLT